MLSYEDLYAYKKTRIKSDAWVWDNFAGQLMVKVAKDNSITVDDLINDRRRWTAAPPARVYLIRELHRNGYGKRQISELIGIQMGTVTQALKHPSIIKHTSARACGQ